MTGDTGDINTVYTGEMHGGKGLAIDTGVGNQDTLGYQRLVRLFEVDVELRSDECHDGFLVSLGTDDQHLITQVEDSVTVRDT